MLFAALPASFLAAALLQGSPRQNAGIQRVWNTLKPAKLDSTGLEREGRKPLLPPRPAPAPGSPGKGSRGSRSFEKSDQVPGESLDRRIQPWEIDAGSGQVGIQRRGSPSGGALGPGGRGTAGGGSTDSRSGGSGNKGTSLGGNVTGAGGGRSGLLGGGGAGLLQPPMAMARGGDSFRVDVAATLPPLAGRLRGVANLGGSLPAMEIYALSGVQGGLMRSNMLMYTEKPGEDAGRAVRQAHSYGMKALITVVGTPEDLASSTEGDDLIGAIPAFARSVPTDPQAWADRVVDAIAEIQLQYQDLPDYVEIGNEPDRPEYWNGTLQDYLTLYELTSQAVKAAFPSVQVGGMGLAGAESDMGGEESALFALIDDAANRALPLDFLSWHSYGVGAQLRYTRIGSRLRQRLQALGFRNSEELVTEWNILPNTMFHGEDFDGSHAAANMVAFLDSAVEQGISGNCFFLLYDTMDQGGVQDLQGKGLGAITSHGVKKPVFRMMEFLGEMADQNQCLVRAPRNEYAVNVIATRTGNTLRLAISNDVVDPDWVWANGCREIGLLPGDTAEAIGRMGASLENPPSHADLIAHGYTEQQADDLMDLFDRMTEANALTMENRHLTITLEGSSAPSLGPSWLMDSGHNAPATHLSELEPYLQQAEDSAMAAATQAVNDALLANGIVAPTGFVWSSDPATLATSLGIPESSAEQLIALAGRTLRNTRLDDSNFLNTLPGAALERQSAAEAGVELNGNTLSLSLEPNAAIVLEINL